MGIVLGVTILELEYVEWAPTAVAEWKEGENENENAAKAAMAASPTLVQALPRLTFDMDGRVPSRASESARFPLNLDT
jgi:hypothetical protein